MLTRAGIIIDTYKDKDIDLNELIEKRYRVCTHNDFYVWTKGYEIGTLVVFKNIVVWEEEKLYYIKRKWDDMEI